MDTLPTSSTLPDPNRDASRKRQALSLSKRKFAPKIFCDFIEICFRPFPSWEMNKIGDCSAFQFVQSMQIEPDGIAWMPDNGREFLRPVVCQPKMVIMNATSGDVIQIHEFPANVVSRTRSFLNDITLDTSVPGDKFGFISDSMVGAVVVYSLRLNRSWKAEHLAMKANNPVVSMIDIKQ